MTLNHGERYGKLTVLGKAEHGRYKCACVCGFSDVKVRAKALMSGRVKSCRRCK